MERIIIEDMFDVAEIMYEDALEGGHATFVGLYEDVAELLKSLAICVDDINFVRVDLEPVELDGYDREYYVSLSPKMELWCSKAYYPEHECYLYGETDLVLIADDCNSKIIERIDYDAIIEIGYEVDESVKPVTPDRHEVVTRVATDETGKLRGFEKSWETQEDGMTYHSTYSFFSSDEKMLKDMMDNFSIKY